MVSTEEGCEGAGLAVREGAAPAVREGKGRAGDMSLWDEPAPAMEEGLMSYEDESDPVEESGAADAKGTGEGEGGGNEVKQNALSCDPKNPLVPQNEDASRASAGGLVVVAFAGFGAIVSALVFSRMMTSIGESEFTGVLPRSIQDKALLPASMLLFVLAVVCVFGLGKSSHAMPVFNDLVFERMRSSWLGVVSLTGLYLYLLFFVSGLAAPVKLGSGSLCRETFFAEPDIQAVGQQGAAITFRSSSPTLMTMLLLLFFARFIFVSVCNSAWHGWQRFTKIMYVLALLTCGLSAYRLFDDLKYCTLASSMPPQCAVIVDSQSFAWYQLADAGQTTICPAVNTADSTSPGNAMDARERREQAAVQSKLLSVLPGAGQTVSG